jgi:hypothetical protein
LYSHTQQAPGHPWEPTDISYDQNVIWHEGHDITLMMHDTYNTQGWDWWKQQGMDTESIIADPLFVNIEKHDYELKSDSPAWKIGFKSIPADKIGLYDDPPYRRIKKD